MAPEHSEEVRVAGDGFLWGVATSAFQIEGALDADGRGRSIWDDFQEQPGAIHGGDRAVGASHHHDHVHEDVELLRWLGVDAYRFSVAWPRVLPEGRGEVNRAGLGFYDRLVDELLAAGIEPLVTLYHWDLPSALQAEGGWTQRRTAEAFADYARVVTGALGDRVGRWVTHNEPGVASLVGHAAGVHAPGLTDLPTALQSAHELLVSHGLAVRAIREVSPQAEVGIVLDVNVVAPAEDDEEHQHAAQLFDGQLHRWFLDPVCGHGYPDDVVAFYGDAVPSVRAGDLELIAEPADFLGVNYYRRETVEPAAAGDWRAARPIDRGVPTTGMGWEIHPEGIGEVLRRVAGRATVPRLYVTENGAAFPDEVGPDGAVHDPERTAYVRAHIEQVEQVAAEGVPVHGYFLWSLVDNFEWAEGYSQRFGIVRSEPDRYVRTPKDSARWYRDHIASTRPG